MKIGLQTWGTNGDVRPFLALAGGLKNAGHDVTLAVTTFENRDYSGLADALGVRLVIAGRYEFSPDELLRASKDFFGIINPLEQFSVLMRDFVDPMVPAMYETAERLCKESDLVVSHFVVHPLMSAAEKFNTPCVQVLLNHSIPSKHLTPVGMPKLGGMMNSISWNIAARLLDRTLVPQVNKLREQIGIVPVKRIIMGRFTHPEGLSLVAISPSFITRPPDWNKNHRLCGFFNIPPADEPWEMPEDLAGFLGKGPKPVFITLGSMMDIDPSSLEGITRLLIESAEVAGVRAIIQTGWDDLEEYSEREDLFFLKKAPHQKIFPHCAAVVHHGGAGSTQTATLAGCPSIIVAYGLDQPLWADVLHGLGIAPDPLKRRGLTAGKLGASIKKVLNRPEMKSKAEALARDMSGENGVGTAVKLIEDRYGKTPGGP